MEFIVIFGLIGGIVWIIWKVRADTRASKEAALDRAWREVLNDPNYMHRRHYEERKREDEAQARKEAGL